MSERKKTIDQLFKQYGFTKGKQEPKIEYKWKMPGVFEVIRRQKLREQRKKRRELLKHEPHSKHESIDEARACAYQITLDFLAKRGITDEYTIDKAWREVEGDFNNRIIDQLFKMQKERIAKSRYGATEAFRE